MSDDVFLDRLAADVKPVRPMRPTTMWAVAMAGLVIGGVFVVMAYHPRPEVTGLMHGVMPSSMMPVVKPLLFLVIGISALWGASGLVRPQGELRPRPLVPAAVMVLFILIGLLVQVVTQEPVQVMRSLIGGDMLCMATVIVGGVIGFIGLWGLWLRRGATAHPAALGALAGLGTGGLMAAAYAIHCNMDAPVYLLSIYGVAVAATSGLTALLGARLLKW